MTKDPLTLIHEELRAIRSAVECIAGGAVPSDGHLRQAEVILVSPHLGMAERVTRALAELKAREELEETHRA